MSADAREHRGFKGWGLEVLGWLLLLAGVAAIFLPGPGLLMLFGGLAILSQQYTWAERWVEPVKKKAFDAAKSGVQSWPRIIGSAIGGLVLIGLGVVWFMDPTIPEIPVFGTHLPAGGWPTGTTLVLSGLIALGLLVYSIHRWRRSPSEPATA